MLEHAVIFRYTDLDWVHRGHEGQRKGSYPTLTPTWKLLIKAQSAHGVKVSIKVTPANNNDHLTNNAVITSYLWLCKDQKTFWSGPVLPMVTLKAKA